MFVWDTEMNKATISSDNDDVFFSLAPPFFYLSSCSKPSILLDPLDAWFNIQYFKNPQVAFNWDYNLDEWEYKNNK